MEIVLSVYVFNCRPLLRSTANLPYNALLAEVHSRRLSVACNSRRGHPVYPFTLKSTLINNRRSLTTC